MIIIGEKINGAIPSIQKAIAERDEALIRERTRLQAAGLDSAIMDPCSVYMMSTIYACDALTMKDKGGRKYNRAYRQGKIGTKK